jgi:MoaA/NifB/PqqE/SkfB family radical SAM enzyme
MKTSDKKAVYAIASDRCNNNCVFCTDFSSADLRDNRSAVEKLDSRPGGRRIVFTAAEPTLNPKLFPLIDEAVRLGYGSIAVITNGRMLAYRDYCARLLASGVSEIIVSLHGARPQIHDSITGVAGSWAQTVGGLSNALALRSPASKVEISVNATVNALNLAHLADLKSYFLSLRGLKNIVFHGLLPAGRGRINWRHLSVRYSRLVSALVTDSGPWPVNVRVWDVPLCVAAPRIPETACEFALNKTEMIGAGGSFADIRSGKTGLAQCRGCSGFSVCGGVYSRYLKTYAASEFHAL